MQLYCRNFTTFDLSKERHLSKHESSVPLSHFIQSLFLALLRIGKYHNCFLSMEDVLHVLCSVGNPFIHYWTQPASL